MKDSSDHGHHYLENYYEPRHEKTCLCNMRITKAQVSLHIISAFVVRCLDSIIPLVSISEISSLYLASVAAQAGLYLTWSQTPKTGFLVARLIMILTFIFALAGVTPTSAELFCK